MKNFFHFKLISAGVLDVSEHPDFDEESGILPKDDDSGSIWKIFNVHDIHLYFATLYLFSSFYAEDFIAND